VHDLAVRENVTPVGRQSMESAKTVGPKCIPVRQCRTVFRSAGRVLRNTLQAAKLVSQEFEDSRHLALVVLLERLVASEERRASFHSVSHIGLSR